MPASMPYAMPELIWFDLICLLAGRPLVGLIRTMMTFSDKTSPNFRDQRPARVLMFAHFRHSRHGRRRRAAIGPCMKKSIFMPGIGPLESNLSNDVNLFCLNASEIFGQWFALFYEQTEANFNNSRITVY